MATGASTPEIFAGDFERVRGALAGAGSGAAWLAELRESAIASLQRTGFPGVRDEDWKYTGVGPLLRERFEPVLPSEVRGSGPAVDALVARATGIAEAAHVAVFVDGCFQAAVSRGCVAKGVRITSLRERLDSDASSLEPWLGKFLPASAHGFAALSTAFLDDGAVIEMDEGALVAEPLHVVYASTARETPFVTHPRSVIVARAGSSATVVEHHVGEHGARTLANYGGEIVLGRGATLAHVRVQDEAASAFHVARFQVEQAGGSTFSSHAFGFGAALSRTEIAVRLAGEEASCELSGLYAVDGSRHVDHHLLVDHAAPRTRSSQLYKGVLEDSSRGVFTGRVVIRPGSQKTKATQSNPSLLLGRRAVAETRPQLEIYADDVACNHGATIGRLDEDALFYLRSRGIDPLAARRLLISGFAAEVVEGIAAGPLRAAFAAEVSARIDALGTAEGAPS